MPQTSLNNVAVQTTYVDDLTVDFGRARAAFALHVFSQAVFYQVALYPMAGGSIEWESGEHFLAPSLSSFKSAEAEGFGANRQFGGIRVRSAVVPLPTVVARVTVA